MHANLVTSTDGPAFAARRHKLTGNGLMTSATLTISSKNYSSWSLRGWLLTKFSGLGFAEKIIPTDDAAARAEILLLAPSMLVPCLNHDGISVWDTMAIAEYLNE